MSNLSQLLGTERQGAAAAPSEQLYLESTLSVSQALAATQAGHLNPDSDT